MAAPTLAISYSQSYDCQYFYFQDTTSDYGDPPAADITSTVITLTHSDGSVFTYTGYLPTQGEVGLLYDNWTAQVADTTDTDCLGCGSTSSETVTSLPDGCYSISYSIYEGDTLVASMGESMYLYCAIRSSIFDLIKSTCDECCNAEQQREINGIKNDYDILLITYNKLGCGSCVDGLLDRLQKRVENYNNDCLGC